MLLCTLPTSQRCAFDLVDLQGFAPVDAARMLGLRPGTLRVNLLRARRAMRGRMLAAAGKEGMQQ
jgi:DNA-directed RNA polymerase specialized sigma24 family protein